MITIEFVYHGEKIETLHHIGLDYIQGQTITLDGTKFVVMRIQWLSRDFVNVYVRKEYEYEKDYS